MTSLCKGIVRAGGSEAALSIPAALRVLLGNLSPRRRRALALLMLLMLAGAVAEVATIGTLLPFLALIADPKGSPLLEPLAPLLNFFGASTPSRAVYVLTGLFVLTAGASAVLRLALLWTTNSLVNGMAHELAVRLYDDALHEPYIHHTRRNSSELIAAISKVELLSTSLLAPLMNGVVALVLASAIIVGLIAIDPIVALAAGVSFSAIYVLTTSITRSRLRSNSAVIAEAQGQSIKAMQEGLGGIRDVLINQSQPTFVEIFRRAEANFRSARTLTTFLANGPRFVVEALGMIMIAAVAVAITGRPGGLVDAIPTLGALAMGAQRLLPLIQQIYAGWAQTIGSQQVLLDVSVLLCRPSTERPLADVAALPLDQSIWFNNVSFSYSDRRAPALTDITFSIPKGARVGIAGKTGSGKSTLMDLLLGLLAPDEGEIQIDGVKLTNENCGAWQRNIAHVPQAIYLADATIAENIAFGVHPEHIDRERVRVVARQAELAEVVSGLPHGFDTFVGEQGIQLSGGQRQRIGIARALYNHAKVLVFDEATSSLDSETEGAVMDAIQRLDRSVTIFIIAHRMSTLEGCDLIVWLEGGRIARIVNGTGAHMEAVDVAY